MSVFIFDKDTAKLCLILRPKQPQILNQCKNELMSIRDFEAVQKSRSRVLSPRNIRILLNRIIAIE